MFTLSCTACNTMVTGNTIGEVLDKFNQKHASCVEVTLTPQPFIPAQPYWYPWRQYWIEPYIGPITIPTIFGTTDTHPPDSTTTITYSTNTTPDNLVDYILS